MHITHVKKNKLNKYHENKEVLGKVYITYTVNANEANPILNLAGPIPVDDFKTIKAVFLQAVKTNGTVDSQTSDLLLKWTDNYITVSESTVNNSASLQFENGTKLVLLVYGK